ncbi:protein of unknown function [Taphrina deformans PYCC 5710]|uniref:Inhibitor I9 domain-containing protein n=1 Tax=Taphrina deformans (strain PYCC 5710 / ATCC 11124 / CBS 356.35 / IMI 108563 / JCM 9778 / NBRC 8474) TaxID=1097556 RepID=R4XCM3_TAPDE|nr:protein of unknown function [Taphrina deformans PYCC 5710]|eukprot:CCG83368.1 protein of unknown function [Taphrina deformans PYCC 5710]
MQNFIVNLKDDASDADVADAKKSIESQGGTIKDSFTLIKGFSASFPEDHVGTLSKHKAVDVIENDGEIKTQ